MHYHQSLDRWCPLVTLLGELKVGLEGEGVTIQDDNLFSNNELANESGHLLENKKIGQNS